MAEPDIRFTLANERTFLAWVRTAIGLVAAGVAVFHLFDESVATTTLSLVLLASAALVGRRRLHALPRRPTRRSAAVRRCRPAP